MAEGQSEGDGDFRTETKYKQFSAAVERALKTFEVSTEWPDLISSLARLNKVLLAYTQYPVVPHQLTVCKRLSQCLHPHLPGGVHLKALDVYRAIFDRIGVKGLASDLLVYSSGLFPLLSHASMSVRPSLLDVYEKYYLPLGEDLLPTLHGLVLGLMPGLEDESEHTDRISNLLDAICAETEKSVFFSALWQCVLSSPSARLPAVNFILSKLNKKVTAEDQMHCLGGNLPLVVSSMCMALLDKNVLVGRAALDISSILFPFHQPFLLPSDITLILSAAVETLLKRDVSLNRRLYAWLLGSQVDKNYLATHLSKSSTGEDSTPDYFETFTKLHLLSALRRIVTSASAAAKIPSKPGCLLPYRLLRALMEKPEISESVIKEVLLQVIGCLKEQLESLGGVGSAQPKDLAALRQRPTLKDEVPKKLGKKGSLKAETLQAANLFFNSLDPEFLWEWMDSLLTQSFHQVHSTHNPERTLTLSGSAGKTVESSDSKPSEENAEQPQGYSQDSSGVPDTEYSSSDRHRNKSRGQQSKSTPSPPSCANVVGLITFLLQSFPLDSMENVHQFYLPKLLLTVLGELAKCEALLAPTDLQPSLNLTMFIVQELLRSPSSHLSSHASTPHTPMTPMGRVLGVASSAPTQSEVFQAQGGYSHEQCVSLLPRLSRDESLTAVTTPVVEPLQQMRQEICVNYLAFYSSFIGSKITRLEESPDLFGPSEPIVMGKSLPPELHTCFSSACHLLLSVSEMNGGPPSPEIPNPQPAELPHWLALLMSACLGSHDIHVTFTALETFIKLLEQTHIRQQQNAITLPLPGGSGTPPQPLLTAREINLITTSTSFVQSVSQFLWSCLSKGTPHLHVEAATFLSWLHTLVAPSQACEKVILEDFASQSLSAYHTFATLWQYMPVAVHQIPTRPFSRVLLWMLEGLQSQNVQCLVQSWVKFVTERGELQKLLQPLVKILLKVESTRTVTDFHKRRKEEEAHAKYFYIPKGMQEKKRREINQNEEVMLHYTQVFDTSQVLYAMSLLQSVLVVDSASIISCLASSIVNMAAYTSGSSHLAVAASTPAENQAGTKSLLELLLVACIDFLRSEYPDSLDVPLNDHLDNLKVKTAAAELLTAVLHEFVQILSRYEKMETSGGSITRNPSYISALVTLCDIQKIALLLLAQVVQNLRDLKTSEDQPKATSKGAAPRDKKYWLWTKQSLSSKCSEEPGVVLESLFLHLLRVLQNLITVDALCSPLSASSSHTLLPPSKAKSDLLPPIVPGFMTAAQPFTQVLLLDILADSSLIHLHRYLLLMLTACLPSMQGELDELVPRVLKQICKNLDNSAKESTSGKKAYQEMQSTSLSGENIVSYLEFLVAIVLWSFFGECLADYLLNGRQLKHRGLDVFWNTSSVTQIEDSNDSFSPTSKQPSTMAWLFGVFTASPKGVASEPGTKIAQVGVESKVGQHITMLLPAVYNTITEIWKHFSSRASVGAVSGSFSAVGGGRRATGAGVFQFQSEVNVGRKKMEFEDVHQLISMLLCPLAERESSTFFSSISHVWLEWNLESKVHASKKLTRRKEAFIEMLHHVQVLPLERLIRCVQFTLSDIARMEEFESRILRQKYLLHFLYKYISSTLQNSEELDSCRNVLVLFLRDCYLQNYSPGANDTAFATCHILCMLTSILHVFVCRVSAPEEKRQKKERRELQDITHKLCEALSVATNVGIAQDYIVVEKEESETTEPAIGPHNKEAQPSSTAGQMTEKMAEGVSRGDNGRDSSVESRRGPGGAESSASGRDAVVGVKRENSAIAGRSSANGVSAASLGAVTGGQSNQLPLATVTMQPVSDQQMPTVQALAVLANVLSHFIDCVFSGSEKDKVHSLLRAVLYNIWPHLRNHSPESRQSYRHAVKLLASLSGFQVTRRAWKKETFDLFLEPDFFLTDLNCLQQWKVIVDNLMTQDKVTFRDLLSRLYLSSTPGMVNLFSSSEQEMQTGVRLVKRMAFAILSGEVDQYVKFLPDIQEKLSDCLKLHRHPLTSREIFLCFRVLLLRISPAHLTAFWPTIITELLAVMAHMEADLSAELSDHVTLPRETLQLYLSACRLLNTSVTLPAELLPHFQLLQWGFVGLQSTSSTGMASSPIARLHQHFSSTEGKASLPSNSISSLKELKPFFDALHSPIITETGSSLPEWNPGSKTDSATQLASVERTLLQDFLETCS